MGKGISPRGTSMCGGPEAEEHGPFLGALHVVPQVKQEVGVKLREMRLEMRGSQGAGGPRLLT